MKASLGTRIPATAICDDASQRFRGGIFFQITRGTKRGSLRLIFRQAGTGDDDYLEELQNRIVADIAHGVEAVHQWHLDIEEKELGDFVECLVIASLTLKKLEQIRAVAELQNRIFHAPLSQCFLEEKPIFRFVVRYQNRRQGRSASHVGSVCLDPVSRKHIER